MVQELIMQLLQKSIDSIMGFNNYGGPHAHQISILLRMFGSFLNIF